MKKTNGGNIAAKSACIIAKINKLHIRKTSNSRKLLGEITYNIPDVKPRSKKIHIH